MRLRYLHLPDYGPLKDIAVVFQQNTHIDDRAGSINFVVGLNGSGKSSLLRALFDIFSSLDRETLPKFPATLAYDLNKGGKRWTVIFHRALGAKLESFLVTAADCLPFHTAWEWREHLAKLIANRKELESMGDFVPGDQLKGNGNLRNSLPDRVLAYTSGDLAPWLDLSYPQFPEDELKDDPEGFIQEDERPIGWTAEKDYFDIRVPNRGDPAYDPPLGGVEDSRTPVNERCILLRPEDAKLAAISLGIWQASNDLHGRSEDREREAYRKLRLAEVDSKAHVDNPARRLINELDWLWPTHAAFHLSSYGQHLMNPHAASCFWLIALADAVVGHPLQEARAVVNLGPCPPLDPYSLVDAPAENSEGEIMLQFAARQMSHATSGASAIRELLAGPVDEEECLWFLFRNFRSWRNVGLLKDIDLTVKRVHKAPDSSGEMDDQILSFSAFSDGEQMLLGRMAMLLLLRRQDNSLLLLDEPETHFNDAWKRKIIDIVDDGILKDTHAQVVVATHTSLALTDVFSCEITRLTKNEGVTKAETVAYPTFGADPGRILLHVFGAPDVIGSRAAEFLRSKLDPAKWPPEDREKLKTLIDEIGSGWPRAKLMEILEKLETEDASRGS